MEFLYVFALMFLSIFGLAVLIHLLFRALTEGASRKFEIYVRDDENIEELLANLGRNPNIGRVCVIVNKYDRSLERLAEKYADVKIVGDKVDDMGR